MTATSQWSIGTSDGLAFQSKSLLASSLGVYSVQSSILMFSVVQVFVCEEPFAWVVMPPLVLDAPG